LKNFDLTNEDRKYLEDLILILMKKMMRKIMIKNLIKLANLFLKFAEKTYNCRHCGAPHKAVDPSGFMCGQCGTTTYPNRAKKK